jgi:hypothetical protein
MPLGAKRFCLAVFMLLVAQAGAMAHDIGESNATFYVRSTGIDVTLFMGLNSAALLIPSEGQAISITLDTFDKYSDRLQAAAPDLLTLTGGDGTTLKPDSMAVSMTEEFDVLYNLHYPLPAPLPGVLKIHAGYLTKMVETHVGTFYVMNAAGEQFGWAEVRPDSQDLEVRLPAMNNVSGTQQPASIAAAKPATEVHGGERWVLWAMIGGGVAALVLAALRAIARKNKARGTDH